MGGIIKAAQVLLGAPRQIGGVMDLTQPGSDRSREAREAAMAAGAVIANGAPIRRRAEVISLADYRARRDGGNERGPAA